MYLFITTETVNPSPFHTMKSSSFDAIAYSHKNKILDGKACGIVLLEYQCSVVNNTNEFKNVLQVLGSSPGLISLPFLSVY